MANKLSESTFKPYEVGCPRGYFWRSLSYNQAPTSANEQSWNQWRLWRLKMRELYEIVCSSRRARLSSPTDKVLLVPPLHNDSWLHFWKALQETENIILTPQLISLWRKFLASIQTLGWILPLDISLMMFCSSQGKYLTLPIVMIQKTGNSCNFTLPPVMMPNLWPLISPSTLF